MISVIIPLYNKRAYIGRALDSVLAQTMPDYEVIVVNDGSTDGSDAVVRAYADPRIRVIDQENQGAGPARQRGFEEARGEYIALLDADDVWLPDFLERASSLLRDFPDAGAGGLGYLLCYENGECRPAPITVEPVEGFRGYLPEDFSAWGNYPPLFSSSIIIRRAVLETIRPRASSAKLGEDQYLWLQLALHCPTAFDSTPGARYYQDSTNRSSDVYRYEGELPQATLLKEALASGRYSRSQREAIRMLLWQTQMFTIRQMLSAKDYGLALGMVCKLWRPPWSVLLRMPYRVLRLLLPRSVAERLKQRVMRRIGHGAPER